MLTTLHIENYALIRESDITFNQGMVAITGETGAGKSILLGALGLLLGQRADTQVLADKQNKCVVEATFNIAGLGLQPLFEQYEADYDDTLILRREILPSSKSRAFVNDSPANLAFLKELGGHIVDIHSQYQTLTLTESRFQTRLIDSFSSSPILPQYQEVFRTYSDLKRHLETLVDQDAENKKTLDYNRFLFNELTDAHLQEGEQEELEEELHLLEHTETIKNALEYVTHLSDDEGECGVVSRLVESHNQLSHVASFHPAIESLQSRMESCRIELQDILSEVIALNNKLSYSPERQALVSERLDLIYQLERKHRCDTIASLIKTRDQLDALLQDADSLDDQIHETMEQVDKSFSVLQQIANQLTDSRRQAAAILEKQIHPILEQLGMGLAQVAVSITPSDTYTLSGHDAVQLLFNANLGGTLRSLSEVASGGELSRLMLSIKAIVTERSLLPTIIFDEIDSGVSGDISVAVGDIMRQMSGHTQVIAISHLPQLAAKAQQHLKVSKAVESEHTISRIRQLTDEERVREIAIMLSSNPPTDAAMQTARELMN